MNKRPVYVVLLALLFCACRDTAERKILGKWRSIKIEERNWDEFFRNSKAFIDTIGNGDSDDTKMALYSTTNMDSLRTYLRAEYDSAYTAFKAMETQNSLHFMKDSSVVVGFAGGNNLGKWYINDSGLLVMDEVNHVGETEHIFIAINRLNKDTLQLAYTHESEGGSLDTSVVTFLKEKN